MTYKVLFEDNFKVDLLRGRATVSRTRTRVKQEMLKCMGNIILSRREMNMAYEDNMVLFSRLETFLKPIPSQHSLKGLKFM